MKTLFAVCLALVLAITLSACTSTSDADKSEFQLQLLHFADVDGGRDIVGNAPRFSAILNKFRSEMSDNTIVLSSGDNWIPGPEYNVASDDALESALGTAGNGRAHVAWLNALGVQASAIGNHELDLGPDDFAELIGVGTEDGDTWKGANFPYLSTNIDFSTDADISGFTGTDGATNTALANKVAAYTTVAVGTETIGVIGATTPSLGTITSIGDMTIQPATASDVDALAALIQADVDALAAKDVNKIILLAHMQSIAIEKELASKLKGVDIIVAGGSNSLLADSNDTLRSGDTAADTYPLMFKGTDSNPVLVVNTDGDYSYLGRLIVDFDADGVLLTSLLDSDKNGAYATDEAGVTANGSDVIAGVKTISDALGTALQARAGNGVGFTSVYLNGERGSVRTEETNLGNLSADANLAYAKSVDATTSLSLKNGGGIRGPIGSCIVAAGSNQAPVCGAPTGVVGVSVPGEISQLDLEIAFRFNNGLTLITVTGEQLLALVENGVSAVEDVSGRFLQIAGMTVSYDPSLTAGSRVVDLVAKDSTGTDVTVVSNGTLDATAAAQTFRMVSLSFLVGGGDDYPFPADDAANIVELEQEDTATGTFTFADDGTEQDVLAEYLSANFGTSATAFNIADSTYDSSVTDARITTVSQ